MNERVARLRVEMEGSGLDAVFLAAPEWIDPAAIRYLTGFQGSSSFYLIGREKAWFLTDARYIEVARKAADGYEVLLHENPYFLTLERLVRENGLHRIGFQEGRVTVAMWREWTSRMPKVAFEGIGRLMEDLRLVKDAGEIDGIRKIAQVASRAFEEVLGEAKGRSERSFAVLLEARMRDLGLEGPGFGTIVASGEHGALPHAHPTERRIGPGDLVTVDFGGLLDGYHSDETVTFAIGEVAPELRRIFDVVQRAEEAGIAATKPGVKASEVDRAARKIVEEAGYGQAFTHGIGHGVGLDIHERPFGMKDSDPKWDDTLEEGMTLTIEPGIYLPGLGGVRLEDLVVVTRNGSERLSTVEKRWRSL